MSPLRRHSDTLLDGAGSQLSRQAALGVLLVWIPVVAGAVTAWVLPLTAADQREERVGSAGLALVAGLAVVAVGTLALPWNRLPRAALMTFPALSLLTIWLLQLPNTGPGDIDAALIVFTFVYAGLVGSVRAVLLLLPFAATVWLLLAGVQQTGMSAPIGIRLVIAASVWATVGSVLARRRAAGRRLRFVEDAHTDVLTGLENGRVLDAAMDEVRYGDVVVVVDFDAFRDVNTARGESGGDTVLAEFGRIVRVGLRGNDRAIRQGGDEFVLVLAEVSPVQVLAVLGRVRDQWQALCGPVTFAAGAAAPRPGETGRDALHRADQHCAQARSAGRDQWVLDDPDGAAVEVVVDPRAAGLVLVRSG
jgi:diguanylate cyclase (GGDEF)-like protein